MYSAYFQMTRNPFEMSPDPYFFFPTEQHREALAGLVYGITERKGFLVLTGEVGTGKSLLVRCLLDQLDKRKVVYAYLFNSLLSPEEFLHYIAEDLGVTTGPCSKNELLLRMSRYLIENHRKGLTTVAIIDEAHHLDDAVLEEVRLLTNLETPQGKLLQIALVGQPELDEKLETHQLRQLKQRITLRLHLNAFSPAETFRYVQTRLRLAGESSGTLFTPGALTMIHYFSSGIPRLINTLCDNSLIAAFAMGRRQKPFHAFPLRLPARHLSPQPEPAAQSWSSTQPKTSFEATGPKPSLLVRQNVSRIFDALRKSEQDRTQAVRAEVSPRPPARQGATTVAPAPFADIDCASTMHARTANGFPEESGDVGAETFRVLRHRLELIRRGRHLQKLLVTSAVPKEGKTTVACRLAEALARSGARVLLIDADLRHPGVHRALGVPAEKGMGDWLEGRLELPSVLQRVEPYGFFYLPAGESHSNPGELLRQAALAEFLTATASTFDWVVVDSPPLVPFVDAHHLATLVDGVLVVLRRGVTPRSAVDQVFVSLERAYVAGAILNGTRDNNHSYYQYYGRERAAHAPAAMPPDRQTRTGVLFQND